MALLCRNMESLSSSSSEGIADQGMIMIVINTMAVICFLERYCCRSEKPTTNHSGQEGFDNGIRLGGSAVQYSFLSSIDQYAVHDKVNYGLRFGCDYGCVIPA